MTITPMSDEELNALADRAEQADALAQSQSYDHVLMLTDLSPYDLENMEQIIRHDHGTWFKAHLLRALHILLPIGDEDNLRKLRNAYPGACAAYLAWYNGRLDKVVEEHPNG